MRGGPRGSTATTWPAALRTARRGGDAYAARWRRRSGGCGPSLRRRRGRPGRPRPGGRGRSATVPGSPAARGGAGVPGAGGDGRRRGVVPDGLRDAGRARATGSAAAGRAVAGRRRRRPAGRARGTRGCGWPRRSTRTRPGAAAAALLDGRRGGPLGATGTSWRGGSSGWGRSELAARPLRDPPTRPACAAALLEGLRREGLGLLRWTPEAAALRQRLAFLQPRLGEPWPDVSDGALHARVDEWLEPELGRARRRADLARIDAGQALRAAAAVGLGRGGPAGRAGARSGSTVPSGSRIRVDYGDPSSRCSR